jgi:hypothetical protein
MIFRVLFYVVVILVLPVFGAGENLFPLSIRIESVDREKVLLDLPIRRGGQFSIKYIHSSDLTPVQDIFHIDERGEMILVEENFNGFGAGLEFMSWEKASVTIDEGKIRVHLKRHFPFLRLRVGRVANHVLTLHGRAISLKEIATGGELLKIWVGPEGGLK